GWFARLGQNIGWSISELVRWGLVHQDGHFGGIEAGIDAIFRLLVPSEIKDAGDRPAIPINHPALQRRIDLARRRLNNRRPERLEKITVDRSNANLEASEIGTRDRLV